jgi:hypothetical protein
MVLEKKIRKIKEGTYFIRFYLGCGMAQTVARRLVVNI